MGRKFPRPLRRLNLWMLLHNRPFAAVSVKPMKITISLPDPLFEAAELLAEELRIPRNQLYAEALAGYLGNHAGPAITARLNEVHESIAVPVEAALAKAQMRILNYETW